MNPDRVLKTGSILTILRVKNHPPKSGREASLSWSPKIPNFALTGSRHDLCLGLVHTADTDKTKLRVVLSVSAVSTELDTSQVDRAFRNWTCFVCSFVLSRNDSTKLFSLEYSLLRTTENCLVLSPVQFTSPTRTGPDNLVLS